MSLLITTAVLEGIARNLREGGYPDETAETVRDALATPEADRNIIGMMANGMLADNGITEWELAPS